MKELHLSELPTLMHFLQVCLDLPADERAQHEAMTGEVYDAERVAAALMTCSGVKWVITDADDDALVVCGVTFERQGVWRVWYLARDAAWRGYGLEVTEVTRGLMQMMFSDFDAHRLEVVCLANRERARHWYERHLGLECEGKMAAYCADQQDAVLYSITRTG